MSMVRFVRSVDYFKLIDTQEKICDDYCKYREQISDPAELEAKCERCPLTTIFDEVPDDEDTDCPWQE